MLSEHRSEARQRVFLKGRISFNNGASSMDCLVRDLSTAGARLALTETATLPDVFDLYIPQKDRSFRSTLRWRRDDGVGVTFDEAARTAHPPAAPPPVEASGTEASMSFLLKRVSELEAENATLLRLLATMNQPAAGQSPAA